MKKILMMAWIGLSSVSTAHAIGKAVGQLGMVEGEVTVDSKQVQKAAKVFEGSVIEVKAGKATLILGKGSVFHLGADTKMVVNEFGVKPTTQTETGELDLKFGRTRALILNKGAEKKDLKIKARAATMGVRGTEIYIDAPKDSQKAIQFFTLEGKAEVQAHPTAATVAVNQNQGVAASGAAPAPGGGTAASGTTAPTMSVNDVKNDIKNSGMSGSAPIAPLAVPPARGGQGGLSDSFSISSVPTINLDPIQDRNVPLTITPKFCNATSGVCP